MNKRGKFVTIEGVEGSGKTTQAALLSDYLRKEGVEVVETREPGGTDIGEKIRDILLSSAYSHLTYDSIRKRPGEQMTLFGVYSAITPTAELLLFLAARAQQVAETIEPALKSGMWVICDRFSDATLAYQGHGRGINMGAIQKLDDIATGGLKPDITILLDLDIETGIRRALSAKKESTDANNVDRIENIHKDFHRRVRKGYLDLASREPDRIRVIPVTGSVEEVHRTVVSLVKPFLVKRT